MKYYILKPRGIDGFFSKKYVENFNREQVEVVSVSEQATVFKSLDDVNEFNTSKIQQSKFSKYDVDVIEINIKE